MTLPGIQLNTPIFINRGPNENESGKEIKLSLAFVWPETFARSLRISSTVVRSHRPSCALIGFERAEIFLGSRQQFSILFGPRLVIVEENSHSTSTRQLHFGDVTITIYDSRKPENHL